MKRAELFNECGIVREGKICCKQKVKNNPFCKKHLKEFNELFSNEIKKCGRKVAKEINKDLMKLTKPEISFKKIPDDDKIMARFWTPLGWVDTISGKLICKEDKNAELKNWLKLIKVKDISKNRNMNYYITPKNIKLLKWKCPNCGKNVWDENAIWGVFTQTNNPLIDCKNCGFIYNVNKWVKKK
jgi:DNA-directed RNA polymerase subunit RPC12/RpoP